LSYAARFAPITRGPRERPSRFSAITIAMPFAYYDKLSPARQRVYRKSDAITSLGLPHDVDVAEPVKAIATALAADDRAATQAACQRLVDALTDGYRVAPVKIRVLARRPSDASGELHGLYEPEDGATRARITVWRRTAERKQVVAFRTFLRTVVHEICHHLDYELFALEETFHTEGFYKRESSLAKALLESIEA
jgi:hypothetical protein